jgi:serine/threonine protein kinase
MLASGDQLGPYEIVGLLGAGGMGEVYRARDPRLRRTVALKISREQFSERFAREARAVAALNHPNVCQVYDVGPNYLVMEFVEGASPKGPLPLATLLDYARQIAAALEAAHDKGIVHRDLKPANILVTADGTLKVLDFGLAKMGDATPIESENSPTFTIGVTQAGMIMGTAAYMAPEQARGKVVDKRADIWAFGVVLYELTTGDPLFPGDTASDTLAAVLKDEPDLTRVPTQLQPLLRRCLAKDPAKRLRDIGDAMALVDLAPPPAPPSIQRRSPLPAIAAGVLAVALVALAAVHFREKPPASPDVVRFRAPLPDNVKFSASGGFVMSPDGRHIAFSAIGPEGRSGIWVRDLESGETRRLPGADTGPQPPPFFWSPDSRYLAYSFNSLKKVDLVGSAPQTICPTANPPVGGAWNADGVIVFGSNRAGLSKVSASGGAVAPLTKLDTQRGELSHQLPTFLSDGKRFLYLRAASSPDVTGIYLGSIDTPAEQQSARRVLPLRFGVLFTRGWLVFQRDDSVYAQRFDEGRLELVGEPVAIAQGAGTVYSTGFFAAGGPGHVVWREKSGSFGQLAWIDRNGAALGTVGEPANYMGISLSPDGQRAAAVITDRTNTSQSNLWSIDLKSGAATRLTFDPGHVQLGAWSPDGKRVAYTSVKGSLYVKQSDGSDEAQVLVDCERIVACFPTSWSPDGRYLLFTKVVSGSQRADLYVLPLQPREEPLPLLATEALEVGAVFSPDGRWFAYTSDESGAEEVYVRPFNPSRRDPSGAGPKWQISTDGGRAPRWRSDGRQLLFVKETARYLVDVVTDPVFRSAPPVRSPSNVAAALTGLPTPDFSRFLVTVPAPNSTPPGLNIVLNVLK